jgi:tRNA (guanine-N7-)-methyltransferase
MDNPARTAAYLADCAQRRAELRVWLAEALRGVERLTLELGCGHGHFLNAYAAAQPRTVCLGVDLLADRIQRAEKKRDRARLANLHFVQAEAADVLAELPSSIRLAEVFILFPDPWPKRRHHKNRLIQPALLSTLAAGAAVGARLCFRTDFAPYFAEARAKVAAHPAWRVAPETPWPFELETVFQSRAESFQSLVAVRTEAPITRPTSSSAIRLASGERA